MGGIIFLFIFCVVADLIVQRIEKKVKKRRAEKKALRDAEINIVESKEV